jgi:hypothetical protein
MIEGNITAVFRGQYDTQNCSVLHISQVSTFDAHWRRQVRILTAVLFYFKIYLREMSAAQIVWRLKESVFN